MAMVRAGLGVAAVPGLAFAGDTYPDLAGIALHGPRISRTMGLIKRKGSQLHPVAAALMDMLRSALARADAG
jgi:DNA-binding transcriptional LysR family regulator